MKVSSLYFTKEALASFKKNIVQSIAAVTTVSLCLVVVGLILLADEPTGNLDPATSLGIMTLLNRINRTGTTVLVATHDREIVDSMRKRVIALEDGRVVRDQQKGVYGYES